MSEQQNKGCHCPFCDVDALPADLKELCLPCDVVIECCVECGAPIPKGSKACPGCNHPVPDFD